MTNGVVIYLVRCPLEMRDYKRFGLKIFNQNGFDVFVWDLSPFILKDSNGMDNDFDQTSYCHYIRFTSRKEVIEAINNEDKKSFVVNLLPYDFQTISIYRALSKNRIPYCIIVCNEIPRYGTVEKKSNDSFLSRALRLTPNEILKYLQSKILQKALPFLKIQRASFALAGGEKSTINRPITDSSTEILWIHALDYDICQNILKNRTTKKDIAVFLDDHFPHTEAVHPSKIPPTTLDRYYPSLCKFFRYVENQLNLNVVIAAHPRSNYELLSDFFEGRPVFKNKTAELVQSSRLALLSCSTSINFPVLFHVPMLFITTNDLENSMFKDMIDRFSAYFDKTPINIDVDLDIDVMETANIPIDKYHAYRQDFIKTKGSEDKPFWEVVVEHVRTFSTN